MHIKKGGYIMLLFDLYVEYIRQSKLEENNEEQDSDSNT